MKVFFLLFIALFLFSSEVSAKSYPYYASIKTDKANVRTGPSVKYPIKWIYKRQNWPVQVTASFESWRKISDIDGEAGWVHETLLTSKRNVVVKKEGIQEVYRLPITTSTILMMLETGVISELLECKNTWCKIKQSGKKGWVQGQNLWGIYEQEYLKTSIVNSN